MPLLTPDLPTRTLLLVCAALMCAPSASRAAERLPDGDTAVRTGPGDLKSAWYGSPTRRYQHAILGDDIEAGSLHVTDAGGREHSVVLPETEVFEDRTPRLADLDGDGRIEVIAIRSFLDKGASIAVYGLRDGALRELAATRPIGRAHRWLNIAGIADYAGMGRQQIAYVETPHIGGTLRFVAWRGDQLKPIADMAGFSNHAIGSPEQGLSASFDFNGDGRPDLALPSNRRRKIRVVGFVGGRLIELHRVTLPAPAIRAVPGKDAAGPCATFFLEPGPTVLVCGPR